MKKTKNEIKLIITSAKIEEKDSIIQKEGDMNRLIEFFSLLIDMDNDLKIEALNKSKVFCIKCNAEIKDEYNFCNTSFKPKCRKCFLKEVEKENL